MDYSESIRLLEYRLAQLEQFIIPAVLPQGVREEVVTLPTNPPRHEVQWIGADPDIKVTTVSDDANAARIINRRLYNEACERFINDKYGPETT